MRVTRARVTRAAALALALAWGVAGGLHAAEPGRRLAPPMGTAASAPAPAFATPRLLRLPPPATTQTLSPRAPMTLQPSAQMPAQVPAQAAAVAATQAWSAGSARLAFGVPVPDQKKPAWGAAELRFNADSAQPFLVWDATGMAAYQWRWQIASQPFAAATSGAGVLAEGDAGPGYTRVDLRAFVPSMLVRAQRVPAEAPVLYIRVAAFKNGQLAGYATNTVVAHFDARANAAAKQQITATLTAAHEQKQKAEALLAKARQTFDLKIMAFKPAAFPDPNRWGCVVVVKNPYRGKAAAKGGFMHPLGGFAEGKEYCPSVDPATQQKSTGEWVWLGVTSYVKVWDGLANHYNGTKKWLAAQFAGIVPCEALGKKAEETCNDAMQEVAGYAISAGLVAAGLPPSLPDTTALAEAAKGKIADAAAEFTCDYIEAQGGGCPPGMREELRKRYAQALDELHKALAKEARRAREEPGCGDAQAAKEHGLLALPCFADFPGAEVRPAPGAAYVPPRVHLRVTRNALPVKGVAGCNRVAVNTMLSNKFVGGKLAGKNLKPADVTGAPYRTEVVGIPPLAVGHKREFALDLHRMATVQVPGNHVPDFYFPNWLILYRGGKGSVDASIVANIDTGPSGRLSGYCAAPASWPLQIAP
jgi:hypothetical protein